MRFLLGVITGVLVVTLVLRIEQAGAVTSAFGHFDSRFEQHHLSIQGDGRGNRIRVEVDATGEAFLVSGSRPIESGGLCIGLTSSQARCELPPDNTSVFILGRGGADKVTLGRGIANATIQGGGGRDLLIGGNKGDSIVGNKGNDIERGRRGPDLIGIQGGGTGGRQRDLGRDALFGGRGKDTLRANDGRRDRRLRCGKGHDMAIKDLLDPRLRSCEVTRRRP